MIKRKTQEAEAKKEAENNQTTNTAQPATQSNSGEMRKVD